jgi:hypothetical protein
MWPRAAGWIPMTFRDWAKSPRPSTRVLGAQYFHLNNLARWRHFSTRQHTITIKLKGGDITWESQAGNVWYGDFAGQRSPIAKLRITGRTAVTAGASFYPMHLSSKENSMHYDCKFNQALQNVFRISINEMTYKIGHAFLVAYNLRSTKRRDSLGSTPWQWHQLQFIFCCHVHDGPVSLPKGRSAVCRVLL